MTASQIPTGQAAKSQAKPKSKPAPPLAEPTISPEQMDQFTRQTEETQQLCLEHEHMTQLRAQKTLSQARVAAMLEGLATQLFTIWNEVWLQRQKAHDDAFKAWLKQLIA